MNTGRRRSTQAEKPVGLSPIARAESNFNGSFASIADHGEHDFLAGLLALDQSQETIGSGNLLAVDGKNQVGGRTIKSLVFVDELPALPPFTYDSWALQAGPFRRAARS